MRSRSQQQQPLKKFGYRLLSVIWRYNRKQQIKTTVKTMFHSPDSSFVIRVYSISESDDEHALAWTGYLASLLVPCYARSVYRIYDASCHKLVISVESKFSIASVQPIINRSVDSLSAPHRLRPLAYKQSDDRGGSFGPTNFHVGRSVVHDSVDSACWSRRLSSVTVL